VLPPVLATDLRHSAAREWVEASVRFAAAELTAGRLVSSGLMTHLSETLLIEAVRRHCVSVGAEAAGWVRAARDPQIGSALALIHRHPLARWTLGRLAREAAMSRSAFVRRFTALLGHAPIAYASGLRITAAKTMLLETRQTIAEIAYGLSYGSEAAFSRAFKHAVGVSPSAWRRGSADGGGAPSTPARAAQGAG
jgi:AraC-like DNA-binding protein